MRALHPLAKLAWLSVVALGNTACLDVTTRIDVRSPGEVSVVGVRNSAVRVDVVRDVGGTIRVSAPGSSGAPTRIVLDASEGSLRVLQSGYHWFRQGSPVVHDDAALAVRAATSE